MLRFYMTHEDSLAGEHTAVCAVFPVALIRAVKFARMTGMVLAW